MGAGLYGGTIGRQDLRTGTGSASGTVTSEDRIDVLLERGCFVGMWSSDHSAVVAGCHGTAGADATEARMSFSNRSNSGNHNFSMSFEFIDD